MTHGTSHANNDFHIVVHRTSLLKSTIHIAGPVLWNSLDAKLNHHKVFIVLNVNIKCTAGLIHCFFMLRMTCTCIMTVCRVWLLSFYDAYSVIVKL